jgi:hypothetical protein
MHAEEFVSVAFEPVIFPLTGTESARRSKRAGRINPSKIRRMGSVYRQIRFRYYTNYQRMIEAMDEQTYLAATKEALGAVTYTWSF